MGEHFNIIASIAIFAIVYGLIIFDLVDRAVVTLFGAVAVVIVKVISQENAFLSIDFNTIGLLISMMIIVMIMKRTGVFEYFAIKMIHFSKADPKMLLIYISIATGIISAFLDNVTTILLILPVMMSVTKDLKLNPVPFIISAVFASNVGGTATLIGDPPNIMIGSKAGLSFMEFLVNDALIAIPILFFTSIIFAIIYRKQLVTEAALKAKMVALKTDGIITDMKLLIKCLVVFSLVIVGFLLHSNFGYESSTIAMAGAVIMLFISKIPSEEIFLEVEWKTIAFFIGLFIVVGGLVEAGVMDIMAKAVINATGGDLFLTVMAVLWVSAIASAFVDNIPFVATMIPLILEMGKISDINIYPLWWALSLGACLGGNGTAIGASANVVAIGMAEKWGVKIRFLDYMKVAFPVMIITILISTVYVYFRYLV